MDKRRVECAVAVVGGGPAGMAAACSAAQSGASVCLIESAPWLGGQIWRHGDNGHAPAAFRRWQRRLQSVPVDIRTQTTVAALSGHHMLLAEHGDKPLEIAYQKLILAVGARELFVPFPGWTLPNVFGVGGLHNFAKLGWPVRGKRVAVAGSGPLLFAAAAHLRMLGAKIVLIAEQADLSELIRFGMRLPFLSPDKIVQGAAYQSMLLGVPYKTHCWPVEAIGESQLEQVRFTNGQKTWDVACDYLACAFGLVSNLELPHLLGCRMEGEFVRTDTCQQTSVPDVYCAGEPTGIAGVDGALMEGRIAGYSAAGQRQAAQKLFAKRDRTRRFAAALAHGFRLRPELRHLARPDTILCRCEDVTYEKVCNDQSWRAAKLYHHVGMGPCQGRTCGGALRFLFGWDPALVRPPVFPVSVETLAGGDNASPEPVSASQS